MAAQVCCRWGSPVIVRLWWELSAASERLLLAGTRPSKPAVATGATRLDLGLLGDFQGIVNLNAEIPDGALNLGVAKQ